MSRLRDLLKKDHGATPEPAPPLDTSALVPPPLPKIETRVMTSLDDRPYASTVCPSCSAPIEELQRTTTKCKTCGEPIVVKSGEDDQWHLLREADVSAFEADEEQVRAERYEREKDAVLEAGFLIGDRSVDVVGEEPYQAALEKLAGGSSKLGVIKPVAALLTREPDKPHEKDAVRVDVEGETVGYIEKWDAKDIQSLMRKLEAAGHPAWVRGNIVGGWEDDNGDENFRIRLDALPVAN